MGNDEWGMGDGEWGMGNGERGMGKGERGQGQMGLMKPIGQPELTSIKFSFSPNLPC